VPPGNRRAVPQHRIVDHLKDKQRFRNLSKRLQRPIEGVLLRVRVESRRNKSEAVTSLSLMVAVVWTVSRDLCPARVSQNGCDLLAEQILLDGPIKMIQSDRLGGEQMRR
jgi:hypothetical protein